MFEWSAMEINGNMIHKYGQSEIPENIANNANQRNGDLTTKFFVLIPYL